MNKLYIIIIIFLSCIIILEAIYFVFFHKPQDIEDKKSHNELINMNKNLLAQIDNYLSIISEKNAYIDELENGNTLSEQNLIDQNKTLQNNLLNEQNKNNQIQKDLLDKINNIKKLTDDLNNEKTKTANLNNNLSKVNSDLTSEKAKTTKLTTDLNTEKNKYIKFTNVFSSSEKNFIELVNRNFDLSQNSFTKTNDNERIIFKNFVKTYIRTIKFSGINVGYFKAFLENGNVINGISTGTDKYYVLIEPGLSFKLALGWLGNITNIWDWDKLGLKVEFI